MYSAERNIAEKSNMFYSKHESIKFCFQITYHAAPITEKDIAIATPINAHIYGDILIRNLKKMYKFG